MRAVAGAAGPCNDHLAALVHMHRCYVARGSARAMFTRNALNSGHRVLASPINGVSRFAIDAWVLLVPPANPQWTGIPTVHTVRPLTSKGLIRVLSFWICVWQFMQVWVGGIAA